MPVPGLVDYSAEFVRKRTGFEGIVEQFALNLESAMDRAGVERILLDVVHSLVPAIRIEMIHESMPVDGKSGNDDSRSGGHRGFHDGRTTLEIPLRSGVGIKGYLCLGSAEESHPAISKGMLHRIHTLCTLAACTLEHLRRFAECSDEDGTGDFADSNQSLAGAKTESTIAPTMLVHDATFLSAVLPFALAQAKRHREFLSLLCVSVDRLGGIQELLGRPAADLLVRNVGESIALLLRSSDIVVRLDDDRIVAVLPRASCEDGLLVAEKIAPTSLTRIPKPP